MAKRNSEGRRAEMAARKEEQRNRVPTQDFVSRGKYTPAGVNRNTRPDNK